MERCSKGNETCLSSQGDAAVELLDLLLEELFELGSLRLERRRQEAIFNGEHLTVDVDVLHLDEENMCSATMSVFLQLN